MSKNFNKVAEQLYQALRAQFDSEGKGDVRKRRRHAVAVAKAAIQNGTRDRMPERLYSAIYKMRTYPRGA